MTVSSNFDPLSGLVERIEKSPPRDYPHSPDTPRTDSVPKPLHVQVAEALGWSNITGNIGHPPYNLDPNSTFTIPRYDLEWSATGPLIEKYRICLEAGAHGSLKSSWAAAWKGPYSYEDLSASPFPTPLLAACYLLLQLAKAHKL